MAGDHLILLDEGLLVQVHVDACLFRQAHTQHTRRRDSASIPRVRVRVRVRTAHPPPGDHMHPSPGDPSIPRGPHALHCGQTCTVCTIRVRDAGDGT